MKTSRYLLFILTFFSSNLGFSQIKGVGAKLTTRQEIRFGTGSSVLLGDLGGASEEGQQSIADFDAQSIRAVIGVSYLRSLSENLQHYIRFDINNAWLHGSDEYSENGGRSVRNLDVHTYVAEMAALYEFRLISERKRTGRGRFSKGFGNFYVFGGISGYFFNPKGTLNGKKYNLYDLTTEGQGLSNGNKKYSRFSFSLPLGFGWEYNTSSRTAFGMSITGRKNFTDFLDDVSTSYYDNNLLRDQNGDVAADIADKNLTGVARVDGQKRGESSNADNFFYVQLTYTYRIGLVRGGSGFGKAKRRGRSRGLSFF